MPTFITAALMERVKPNIDSGDTKVGSTPTGGWRSKRSHVQMVAAKTDGQIANCREGTTRRKARIADRGGSWMSILTPVKITPRLGEYSR